jgi:predicted transport protein
VDIIPQKSRLILSLNIQLSDIIDPKGLCTDVSGLRRWGNGKIEASLHNISEIDSIIELIQQAFDKQMESS